MRRRLLSCEGSTADPAQEIRGEPASQPAKILAGAGSAAEPAAGWSQARPRFEVRPARRAVARRKAAAHGRPVCSAGRKRARPAPWPSAASGDTAWARPGPPGAVNRAGTGRRAPRPVGAGQRPRDGRTRCAKARQRVGAAVATRAATRRAVRPSAAGVTAWQAGLQAGSRRFSQVCLPRPQARPPSLRLLKFSQVGSQARREFPALGRQSSPHT